MAHQKEIIEINVVDNSTRGFRSAQNKLSAFERTVRRVQTTMLGFVGINIFTNTVIAIANLSDKAIELDAKLRIMTASTADYTLATSELNKVSKETGSLLEANITLFTRINPALRAMGESTRTSVGITRALAQALRLSGASMQESSSTVRQFSQAMASGVLRGEEFNSLAENSPVLMKALSDSLSVAAGELRAMAKQGELTAKTVVSGLKSQFDAINEMHKGLPLTIGRAWTNVNNAALNYFKSLKDGNSTVAQFIDSIASNFNSLVRAAHLLTISLSALFAVKFVRDMMERAEATRLATAAIEAQTLAATRKAEKEAAITAAKNSRVVIEAKLAAAEARSAQAAHARVSAQLFAEQRLLASKIAMADAALVEATAERARHQAHTSSAATISAANAKIVASQKAVAAAQLAAEKGAAALTAAQVNLSKSSIAVNVANVAMARSTAGVAATSTAAAVKIGFVARAAAAATVTMGTASVAAKGLWLALGGWVTVAIVGILAVVEYFDKLKVGWDIFSTQLERHWARLTKWGADYEAAINKIDAAEQTRREKRVANTKAIEEGYVSLVDKVEKLALAEKKLAAAHAVLGSKGEKAAKAAVKVATAEEKAELAAKKLQKSALEAFTVIAENSSQTAEAIISAFDGVFSRVDNKAGLRALEADVLRLKGAYRLTTEQAGKMLSAIEAKMPVAKSSTAELKAAVDDLGVSIAHFGESYSDAGRKALDAITALASGSKEELLSIGGSAKESADIIRHAIEAAANTVSTQDGVNELQGHIDKLVDAGVLKVGDLAVTFSLLEKQLLDIATTSGTLSDSLDGALEGLDVSVKEAVSGVSDIGREAILQFQTVIDQIDIVGLTSRQQATVIYNSFSSALSSVSSEAGLADLKGKLLSLGRDGQLSGERVRDGLELIETKLEELSPAVEVIDKMLAEVGASFDGAKTALELTAVGNAAKKAYDDGLISIGQYKAVVEDLARKKKTLAETTEKEIRAEKELADARVESGALLEKAVDAEEKATRRTRAVQISAQKVYKATGEALKVAIAAADEYRKSLGFQRKGELAYFNIIRTATKVGSEAAESYRRKSAALARLTTETDRLVGSTSVSIDTLRAHATALKEATDGAGGAIDTSQSLDKVRDRMREIKSATESVTSQLSSLKQELLSLEGKGDEAAELRHKQRILEMQAQIVAAQAEGNEAAVESLRDGLAVLEKIGAKQRQNRSADQEIARQKPQVALPDISPNIAKVARVLEQGSLQSFIDNIGATTKAVGDVKTQDVGEKISVQLSIGSQTATGTFDKTDETMRLIDELRSAGAAS